MRTTRAVILAGGEGSRLGVLTDKRGKTAVPSPATGSSFTLSTANSGITDVMMLTQYNRTP
jgi:glucose-1-phosphate adenylyltransferase